MATFSRDGKVLLDVRGVGLNLGGKIILRDVSVQVHDVTRPGVVTGQVVGFLGPSGIGKTQFSRVLAGLQPPTSGEVHIGENGTTVKAGLVGYVTQDYRVFRHRRVLDNLVRAARKTGLDHKSATEKAKVYLERFGLSDRANFYPKDLSGGQRQRVAILQQVLCSEHYVIMDEPFSGLDVINLDKVCVLINEVASMDEFNTIIVITHDVRAAMLVSDVLWLMGRDRKSDGSFIPGARIVKTYDLAAMGLAWDPTVESRQEFRDLVPQIRNEFKQL